MSRKICILFFLALLLSLVTVGCGAAPTPTKPAPTQPPQVVTVVITATPPPATPIPTIALTATVPISTPVSVKPTATPGTPKPVATKKPTPVAATATASPLPLKFAAPRPLLPIWIPDGQKDERHYPTDALIFQWTSVGGLGGDECYAVTITFVPGAGDSFLTSCGDQTQQAYAVQFTLNQPNRQGPNYSALLPVPNSDIWVNWYVTVVKNGGAGSGPVGPDGARHKTMSLSPPSDKAQFLLKGIH